MSILEKLESEKDWEHLAFRSIYMALALADELYLNDDPLNWLNENGFCNLTVCPECRTDDFTHVEGCRIAESLKTLTISYVPLGQKATRK